MIKTISVINPNKNRKLRSEFAFNISEAQTGYSLIISISATAACSAHIAGFPNIMASDEGLQQASEGPVKISPNEIWFQQRQTSLKLSIVTLLKTILHCDLCKKSRNGNNHWLNF
jgi:hypothetical protein